VSDTLTANLARALTALAANRWGTERASQLAEAIASTAETLALVAAARFELDELEPDPHVHDGVGRVQP
jgi:hypothetical protein